MRFKKLDFSKFDVFTENAHSRFRMLQPVNRIFSKVRSTVCKISEIFFFFEKKKNLIKIMLVYQRKSWI